MHMKLLKSNRLLQTLKAFFEKHYQPGRPLLLGYSGGRDSELLFHLLLLLRKDRPFELHLAHVDHGWRKESADQAEGLKKKAKLFDCPFHLKRLSEKNSEEDARKLRFSFFQTLFAFHGFQALLLAHHKNDVAETVFKRFLEGAHLPFLFGMEEKSVMGNISIWRPLLPISKKEILDYSREKKLSSIDDATNRDPSYLRARMRQELLPFLEKSFGKSILQNLYEASVRSSELKKYLDGKTQHALEKTILGPLGYVVPMSVYSSLERVEKIHLLKRICQEKRIELSRASLQEILSWTEKKKTALRFFTKEALFVLDRDSLFIQTESFPPFEKELPLCEGSWEIGAWRVSVLRSEDKGKDQNSWEDFWKSGAFLYLPEGKYSLSLAKHPAGCMQGPSLKKWWEVHKTPAFMRKHLPVIYQGEKVVGEFLSGKRLCRNPQGPLWKVGIKIRAYVQ